MSFVTEVRVACKFINILEKLSYLVQGGAGVRGL